MSKEGKEARALSIEDRAMNLISNIKQAIAKVGDIDEAVDIASRAKAFHVSAQSAGQSLAILNEIAELKIRAERQAGNLLVAMEKKSNQHGATNAALPSLEDLGISKMQSSRWQSVARVDEKDFAQYCKRQRDSGQEITQAGVIRLKSRREDAPRDKPHFPCPSCGLRSNRCIDTGDVLARVLPRRRKCLHCGYVFRTWEFVIDPENPPRIPVIYVGRNDLEETNG